MNDSGLIFKVIQFSGDHNVSNPAIHMAEHNETDNRAHQNEENGRGNGK